MGTKRDSMTAKEMIRRLSAGQTVRVTTAEAVAFMDECERERINCRAYMNFNGRDCKISAAPAETEEN